MIDYIPPGERRKARLRKESDHDASLAEMRHVQAQEVKRKSAEIRELIDKVIKLNPPDSQPVEILEPVGKRLGKIAMLFSPNTYHDEVTIWGGTMGSDKKQINRLTTLTRGWLIEGTHKRPQHSTSGWGETTIHPEMYFDVLLTANANLYEYPTRIQGSPGFRVAAKDLISVDFFCTNETYPVGSYEVRPVQGKLRDGLLGLVNSSQT